MRRPLLQSASDGSPRGVSLLELIIVIAILATLAVIAIPRMSRSGQNADVTALYADFQILNRALERYTIEHTSPPSVDEIVHQLTQYTDADGTGIAMTPDAASGIVLGPYLVRIPPVPLGPNQGATGISDDSGLGIGWIYEVERRRLIPNLEKANGDMSSGHERLLDDLTGDT